MKEFYKGVINKMVFSLRNISKQYDNKEILNIDELDIKEGEIYCITGPNGAG